jgi:hypothetical protein
MYYVQVTMVICHAGNNATHIHDSLLRACVFVPGAVLNSKQIQVWYGYQSSPLDM